MAHLSSLSEEVLSDNMKDITESGGYEFDFVDNVDDEYACCICLHVMKDPYQIVPCGHRCCRSCLNVLLKSYGDKTLCPIDREPVKLDRIFPDNSCKRKISNMKVKCKEFENGCDWQAELQKYNDHTDSCLFVRVQCSNEGCSEFILRKDKADHEGSCTWRIIKCDRCLDKIRAFQLKEHKRVDCPYENIPCQNKCLIKIPRSKMTQHISDYCPEAIVNCPLKPFGCVAEMPRKHLNVHLQNNEVKHLETLCNEVENMKKELKELRTICESGFRPNRIKQDSDDYNYHIWNTPPLYEIVSLGEIYSAPYSTGPRGYCFVIAIKRRESDTVLSIKLIPGIYDNLLPWPFRCDFSIMLLDQDNGGERCHLKKHMDFSDFGSDSQVPQWYHRPIYGEDKPGVYPLLAVLNYTLAESRYSPDGSALILVKIKSYNCEENLGL